MKYLSVRKAAEELGVHENTIRRWEQRGVIKAARLPGSGYRRFPPEEVAQVRATMLLQLTRDHSSDAVPDSTPVIQGSVDDSLWDS